MRCIFLQIYLEFLLLAICHSDPGFIEQLLLIFAKTHRLAPAHISVKGNIRFKLRFNTQHGDTDLHWRVILTKDEGQETEYLVRSIRCEVPTHSDASYEERVGQIKYNMAGECSELLIDEEQRAVLR